MRLLNPNPGECVDRQTILELKMKHGGIAEAVKTTVENEIVEGGVVARRKFEAGPVNIQPFIEEHAAIQRHLQENWFPEINTAFNADIEFDRLYDELAEVNAVIWKLMDQADALVKAEGETMQSSAHHNLAHDILFSIIKENAKRAELVKSVNRLFRIEAQEKIFA